MWEIEDSFYAEGWNTVCGVDEAGRGPLAGPVFAAAVLLPHGLNIEGLNDSKKLAAAKREALFDVITEKAVSYGIALSGVDEIEEYNILNATFLAMNRAVEKMDPFPELILIDGNRNTGIKYISRSIVKGDEKSASIAAASILAKVSRDRYMLELCKEYPQYCFEKHKGYATALHYQMIREYGPSPVHRKRFLRKMH